MSELTIKTCLACRRDFIPYKCPDHCVNDCCRSQDCERTRRDSGHPANRKCVHCGNPRKWFQKFASCTENCHTRMFFQSTRDDPTRASVARRTLTNCHTLLNPDMFALWHRPSQPERVHIKYCSLRCYNSLEDGHETRVRRGKRRRARTQETDHDKNPGWRTRWRQEQGYFRQRAALRRIQQGRDQSSGFLGPELVNRSKVQPS